GLDAYPGSSLSREFRDDGGKCTDPARFGIGRSRSDRRADIRFVLFALRLLGNRLNLQSKNAPGEHREQGGPDPSSNDGRRAGSSFSLFASLRENACRFDHHLPPPAMSERNYEIQDLLAHSRLLNLRDPTAAAI